MFAILGSASSYHDTNEVWCHALKLSNGEVSCSSPRGGHHRVTRCLLSCDRGYKRLGRSSVQCMPNRRWSGSAVCRKIRCHVLPLIDHSMYSCTRGFVVDSRCDNNCYEGYQIEGDRYRMCQEEGTWSGTEPTCAGTFGNLKCPLSRVKVAEPGKVTAMVSWERPVSKDTADRALQVLRNGPESGSDFPEGIHVIRYKVSDQARNTATCKFTVHVEVRRCPKLKPPMHGYLMCSSDGNNYGAVCEYHCDPGFERTGFATRVCQLNRNWSDEAAQYVRSAGALLDQFYEKRRLLVVSTPDNANQKYRLQNIMLQKAECGLDLRRQALHISTAYFTMVLLDEYGVDRERFVNPTTSDELYSYVEEYLLTEELERLAMNRDFCD
uniref:Sushi repeat-containing protein SRPX2 n=1 Tax=Sinocyclocheilus rhinocerous TaxID=307959 RepID=A0A673GJA2_9TELE